MLLNNCLYMSKSNYIFRNTMPGQRRHGRVNLYVSSSSAKRRELKQTHCYFCVRQVEGVQSLKQHLEQSPACFACYCRKYHCKSVDAVLIKMFACICCGTTENVRLYNHLNRNPQCFQMYLSKFEAKDIR